ncbi:reca-superfamily ATPase possibly involved in signal transduction [Halogeometricum borinquense DSM 11551]|uniref:RecA-superfamily ATPase possibly involved in Signal transduction n=1 Tax=Halogeometricum borinquense (strain ATCC 700274 / DSM 11551 / JCM 10706 / KCTC 4070 / PR3) TaxID=469382 RepID=E4NN40_HALBP|nr:ATPase domain-containing protein [Halogeometricum borinquense]ADQ66270.1 RecA-superfamily ATPase possibly involved in signal transduction [Halogeometricum borinquense DSM 11551]ELY27234.1 reca-superfamily ATPase possibly involved in signal transduction [Halogeometricum borinquense DSM 11551]
MRIPSGVSGFDHLIQGGFLPGRLYVLSGPPGSGKTTFTTQYVAEGLRNGENCMYITMHESREELVNDMSSYDFGFETLTESDQFRFINLASQKGKHVLNQFSGGGGSSGVQSLTDKIVAFVNSRKVDRLVIDSTMLLQLLFTGDDQEMTRFLTALKQGDATTLLISEMTDPSSYSDEHFLAHGVIFFHNYLEATGMTRGIQVVKMRGTDIDCDIRSLNFTDEGLVVDPMDHVEF